MNFNAHPSEWIWYLLGAFLTLIWKWGRYCLIGRRSLAKPLRMSTREWFLERSRENAVSWITTIGFVWALGVLYIDRVTWGMVAWMNDIPVVDAYAFLLGSIAELAAPAAAKWAVSKIPYAGQLQQPPDAPQPPMEGKP